jgi:hypothetical protein
MSVKYATLMDVQKNCALTARFSPKKNRGAKLQAGSYRLFHVKPKLKAQSQRFRSHRLRTRSRRRSGAAASQANKDSRLGPSLTHLFDKLTASRPAGPRGLRELRRSIHSRPLASIRGRSFFLTKRRQADEAGETGIGSRDKLSGYDPATAQAVLDFDESGSANGRALSDQSVV